MASTGDLVLDQDIFDQDDVLGVVGALLRSCRRWGPSKVKAACLEWQGTQDELDYRAACFRLLATFPDRVEVDGGDLQAICDHIGAPSALPLSVRVRRLAAVIDDRRRRWFPHALELRLRSAGLEDDLAIPGECYPRPIPDARKAFPGTDLASPAFARHHPGDQLPGAWLAEDAAVRDGIEVRYDRRLFRLVDTLVDDDRPVTIATAHPNADLAREFTPVTTLPGRPGSFFDFAPRLADQATRYERTFEAVAAEAPNIVLYPELHASTVVDGGACPMEVVEAAWRAYASSSLEPALLASGSRHRHGPRRNEMKVFAGAGHQSYTQTKFNPAEMGGLIEGLEPGSKEVRVHFTPRFAIVVLICADLLHPDVPSLLEDLGVNMALVCSMTPTVKTFDGLLGSVVVANQGVAVVCNGPALQGAERPRLALFDDATGSHHHQPRRPAFARRPRAFVWRVGEAPREVRVAWPP